jgi:hypothetical protein
MCLGRGDFVEERAKTKEKKIGRRFGQFLPKTPLRYPSGFSIRKIPPPYQSPTAEDPWINLIVYEKILN